MHFKKTFCSLLPLMTQAALPFVSLSSCSNQSLFLLETEVLFNESISEFQEICKHPHPTFGTRQICDHIKEFLSNIGYSEVDNVSKLNGKNKFFEDDYYAEKYGRENSSGNLYFDIPPTEGCETTQGVVLQAHMDMVLEGVAIGKELTQPIIPVIDGDTIHTKDYETSLGADNGASLSFILSLTKNPTIIQHGPIRCVITTDEEDGISGASKITYDGLKYNHLINLDGDFFDKILISAAGTKDIFMQLSKINTDFVTNVPAGTIEYKLTVSGLLGGHSAMDINENRACAIKLVSDLTNWIKTCTPSEGGAFSLISMESKNSNNAISNFATTNFATTLSSNEIDELIDMEKDLYLKNFPLEKNIDIKCEVVTSRSQKGLTIPGSRNILDLIPWCMFGPINWLDEDRKEVKTSCNLSSLTLNLSESGEEGHPQFRLEHLIRSVDVGWTDKLSKQCQQLADDFLQEMLLGTDPTIVNVSATPPWETTQDDMLRQIAIEGFKNAGEPNVKLVNTHGWLETGYFFQTYKSQGIESHMISIGPTITDCHSKRETLYLKDLKKIIQTVLYIIYNINSFN